MTPRPTFPRSSASWRALIGAALAAAHLFLPQPAQACRLALALGFDVSRSVDEADYRLQIDGIVAALFDPAIRRLILDPPEPVALAVFEWAGLREQALLADWTLLDSAAAIDALAQRILLNERRFDSLTAIGPALAYAHALFDAAPACTWQTLDLSGDGQTNAGPHPQVVYRDTDFSAITVNGLAIGGHESTIRAWFERHVRHGPGAFVEYAPTHRHFAETFRRKLIRELSEQMIGSLDPPLDLPGPGPS
ncbi:hypothetical protein C4N9_11005 [Pararhodobacter marinus]|uniref:DUF1194 domain-containing protein n=1 Tax=Pararhodobacter marinus TaxID=2184063 RepID=A0A2U2C9P5_9RHOB|nr:DUF1194 domain-containing protein [Pararhodobacter marinus]PWE28514.1 hypothetical protein C4N9_11005 [Pararhodobacter marinus]